MKASEILQDFKTLSKNGFGKPVKVHDLSFFVRQLSTMLSAGVPLYQSLHTIGESISNKTLRDAVEALRDKIKTGTPFSSCLAENPKIFPPLMVGLTRVGEVSGLLEMVYAKYADLLEWDEEFRSKLFTMMIYPAVIMSFGLIVLVLILVFVLPRFVAIFADYNQALPMPTLILMRASWFFANFWWAILLLAVAGFVVFKRYVSTPEGRLNIDRLVLRLPFVGQAVHKAVLSRFFFLLSVMLGSGVPLLEALAVTSSSIGNKVLSGYLDTVSKNVKRGEPLSKSLKEFDFFPKPVIQMMQVGEETGKMETVLNKVAASYERETETVTRRLMILIEPLFILGVALMVGYMAIALLLPIMNISTVIK